MNETYKIMVVDDSEENREAVAELLRMQDFTVEEAHNGKDALAKNIDFQAHLFLLDVVMPEMDGLQLLNELNVKDHNYEVIIMTAYENLDDAKKAMELGALCYISKPIQKEELNYQVQKALARVKLNRDRKDYQDVLENEVKSRTEELQKTLLILKNQSQRLDAIVNSMSEGLLAIDNNENIALMNYQTQKLLKTKFFECAGEKIWTAIKDEQLNKQLRQLVSRQNGFRIVKGSISIRYDTHDLRNYQVTISDISDENNNSIGKIITFTDNTEKVNAERLRNALLSIMSHELRTPVNVIMNNLSLFKLQGNNNEIKEELIQDMQATSSRLKSLVNNIIYLAKLSDPSNKPCPTVTGIDNLIKKEIENLKAEILEKKLKVKVDSKLGKNSIMIDQTLLSIAFAGVLNNAVKFNRQKGLIIIEVNTSMKNKKEDLVFTIQDEGIGMSRETQNNLFTGYFQAEEHMTRNFSGIGIGLYLAKLAIDTLGGSISVSSTEGEGSTFTLQIPLHKS